MKKKIWKFRLGKTIEIDLREYIGEVNDCLFIDYVGGQLEVVGFISNSKLTIVEGYEWDGCTPKFRLFGFLVGVPDFDGTKKASMVHDFLIEYCKQHNISRFKIDKIFEGVMNDENFLLKGLYAGGVNLFRPISLKFWPC